MFFKYFILALSVLFSTVCFTAPKNLSLTTIQGQVLTKKDLIGRWLILHYWASWCDVCISEMPVIQKLTKTVPLSKAQIFLINYDHLNTSKQLAILHDLGVTAPSLQGNPAAIFGIKDISALPTTIVINPKGEVQKVFIGPQLTETFINLLA